MLSSLASLLILSFLTVSASEERHVDAVEVFSCDFDSNWDVNYDLWPDNWRRQRGSEWPLYVGIGITEDSQAVAGRCLTVKLNGGSAQVSSPAISISDKFSYVVEARLRSQKLKHSRTKVRIDFCDENRKIVESFSSEWLKNTNGWIKLHIGPVNISHPEAQLAMVTLLVERGEHVDLEGTVSLDDIWIARLPRMTVHTNSSFNVYTDPRDIVVTCDLSGILEKDPDIHFELRDASSLKIDDTSVRLEGRLITERVSRASDIVSTSSTRTKGYAGSTQWRPPIREYGFYQVYVSMRTKRGTLKDDLIKLVVVPPIKEKGHGEFGWSLAGDHIPLTFQQLEELLPRVAVSWIKLPVWYGETETERGEQLVIFSERLAAKDIEIVGVIDRPPLDLDLGKRVADDVTIADLLSSEEPSAWLPSLDAVLTRLSLRVRWWQLGVDHDTSFSDFHNLEEEIGGLRAQLFRFGQDVKLGLGWPWNEMEPNDKPATWDFQQLSATPALTGEEVATYLSLPKREGVARWAMVQPLQKNLYTLETRTRDLVQQMLAAKINGADGIFVSMPFDEQQGLMSDDGTPGELLLPWRTTASLLSGSKYLGQIRLPNNSENHLFETSEGEVLMVVWSRHPQKEVLYLGHDIRIVDVWGRSAPPEQQAHQQVVEVKSLPTFIVGLDPQVAKWRTQVRFSENNIPSVMGAEHPNRIEMTNTFAQGAGGSVHITAPDGWQIVPDRLSFKLSAGERAKRPFQIILPFDANSGVAKLRTDFAFTADQPYRFSIYREIKVGDQEIELELNTRINEKGMLVVEQRMINHSTKLTDFKCLLRAKGHKTQRMQVYRLGNSYDLQTYLFPNGKELLGTELTLRAEELGGSRVFNHRITIEQ